MNVRGKLAVCSKRASYTGAMLAIDWLGSLLGAVISIVSTIVIELFITQQSRLQVMNARLVDVSKASGPQGYSEVVLGSINGSVNGLAIPQ